jgi:hypothetical protein
MGAIGAGVQTSYRAANSLLAVERHKERVTSTGFPAAPIGVGIINLLFCAMMDNFIRTDQTDHHMLLFMFVECSGVALVCCGIFVRSMSEIVNRTSIFPIGAWSYLLFFFQGFLKRPVMLALLLTTGLSLGVFVHGSMLQVSLCVTYLSIAFMIVQLTVACLALMLVRSSQPVALFGLLVVSITVAIVGATLIINVDSLLRAVPVVGWTVQGIAAARIGDTSVILLTFVYDAAALAVLGLLGLRMK